MHAHGAGFHMKHVLLMCRQIICQWAARRVCALDMRHASVAACCEGLPACSLVRALLHANGHKVHHTIGRAPQPLIQLRWRWCVANIPSGTEHVERSSKDILSSACTLRNGFDEARHEASIQWSDAPEDPTNELCAQALALIQAVKGVMKMIVRCMSPCPKGKVTILSQMSPHLLFCVSSHPSKKQRHSRSLGMKRCVRHVPVPQ